MEMDSSDHMLISIIRELTDLGQQYGPFLFAILFLIFITAKTHKQLLDALTNADGNVIIMYKFVHGGAWAVSIILTIISIVWFFLIQPRYYQFSVVDLQPHETLWNSKLYALTEEHKPPVEGAPSLKDMHFIFVDNGLNRFSKNINLHYFKNKSEAYGHLTVPFGDSGSRRYRIFYDEKMSGESKYMIKQSLHFPEIISSAHAGFSIIPNTEINPETKIEQPRTSDIWQDNAETTDGQNKILCEDPAYNSLIICPHNRYTSHQYSPSVRISPLRIERASVPTKIEALRIFLSLTPMEREEVARDDKTEPFILTLADLTRHNDTELATIARQGLASINAGLIFADFLIKNYSDNAALDWISRIDDPLLEKVKYYLKDSVLTGIADTSPPKRLLKPTASADGDRYYVKAAWDRSNTKAKQCLSEMFNTNLITNRSLEEEKKFMENRSERIVYWYSKTWVLEMAKKIEYCGGKAKFIGF